MFYNLGARFLKAATKVNCVITLLNVKIKVSRSPIAVGAVGVRDPLYFGHS